MHITAHAFKANAVKALNDAQLRQALRRVETNFTGRRAEAKARLPEFDALRDQARDIKDHVLANLDFYLEAFEARVTELGGTVHWCPTAADARDTVIAICRAAQARTVTKSKSMIGEEIAINEHLEAHGIEPVE